jgi:hypothetical protein
MKNILIAVLMLIIANDSNAQTCTANTAPNLVIKSPVYISGSGTGAGTVNAQYRFSNVTNVTPSTTDVIVTITAIVNAVLTNIDDDASNPVTANNFQPVVTENANSTGYIEFNFMFVTTGTTNPFSQTCINFTALDIDGQTGVQEQVKVTAATSMAFGSPTYLSASSAGGLSVITSNNIGCNGICTNMENVCNFGKINSSNIVFTYGEVNTTAAAVTRYGSFQFSPYLALLTGGGGLLPLKFGKINATLTGNVVEINWNTFQEINLKYFEIEKSNDGVQFNTFKIWNASNNYTGSNYSVLDNQIANEGLVYYRIKAVDIDGRYSLSAVVKVVLGNNVKSGIQIFPSPVKGNANISIASLNTENNNVMILDIAGKVQLQYNIAINKGMNVLPLNNINTLTAGTYIVKVYSAGGQVKVMPFIKL